MTFPGVALGKLVDSSICYDAKSYKTEVQNLKNSKRTNPRVQQLDACTKILQGASSVAACGQFDRASF